MSSALVAAIFTLIGGIIGYCLRMNLRKEKFKELIYKEKLAAYKKLSERLWEFYAAAIDILIKKSETEKLFIKSMYVSESIGRKGLFISEAVNEKVSKFLVETQQIVVDALERSGESIDILIIQRRISYHYTEAADAIRQDVKSDIVSEEIHKTLHFPLYLAKKPCIWIDDVIGRRKMN